MENNKKSDFNKENELKLQKYVPGFKGYGKAGIGIEELNDLIESYIEYDNDDNNYVQRFKDIIRDTYFVELVKAGEKDPKWWRAFGEGNMKDTKCDFMLVRIRQKSIFKQDNTYKFVFEKEEKKIEIKLDIKGDEDGETDRIQGTRQIDGKTGQAARDAVVQEILNTIESKDILKNNYYTEDELKKTLYPLFTIFNCRHKWLVKSVPEYVGDPDKEISQPASPDNPEVQEAFKDCTICFDEYFYVYGDGKTDPKESYNSEGQEKIAEELIKREHSKYYHEIEIEVINKEGEENPLKPVNFPWVKNLCKMLKGKRWNYNSDCRSKFKRGKNWLENAEKRINIYDLKYSRKGQIASHLSEIFQDCGCGYQSGTTWSDGTDGSYLLNDVRKELREAKSIYTKRKIIKKFLNEIKQRKDVSDDSANTLIKSILSDDEEDKKFFYKCMDLPYYEGKEYGLYKIKIDKEKMLLLYLEFTGTKRTRYSREFDRIILTNSFRHLQYKTQVMINSASDDQRTRLLHSIEVQKIAKTLALQLGANWELAEAMGIGHDVGHAPFGHSGEYQLDKCLEENYFGKFSHALQGVKVLNHIEFHELRERYGLYGIGLSKRVLEGILKHDSDALVGDLTSPEYQLQYYCPELWDIENNNVYENAYEMKIGSLEAQIVFWADKITYLGHDWEEFAFSSRLDKMTHRITEMYTQMGRIIDASQLGNTDDENAKEEFKLIYRFHRYVKSIQESFNNQIDEISDSSDSIDHRILADSYHNILGNSLSILEERKDLWSHDDRHDRQDRQLRYFTKSEYKCLYHFLKIAKVWIHLTDELPDIPFQRDLIHVIHDYLKKIDTRIITTAVQDKIISETLREIKKLRFLRMSNNDDQSFDEAYFRKVSNDRWQEASKKLKNKGLEERKKAYRENLLVSMHKDYLDDVEFVMVFTRDHYIHTTQVCFMTEKAKKIIRELFNYYLNNRDMLPFEERNRYNRELSLHEPRYYSIMTQYYKNKYNKEFYPSLCTIIENVHKIEEEEGNVNHDAVNLEEAKIKYKKFKEDIKDIADRVNNIKDTQVKGKEKRDAFIKFSKKILEYEVQDVVWARIIADYVASMTDRMAVLKYKEITSEKTAWSTNYSE